MTRPMMAFLRFWYDFIVGDDWRVALAVVAGLALTYATSGPAWWILPVVVVVVLPLSLWRATRARPMIPPIDSR